MTMNLDDHETNAPASKPAKLSRKEKKALKAEKKKEAAAEKEKLRAEKRAEKDGSPSEAEGSPAVEPTQVTPEEVSAQLEPAPIPTIPPPQYTLWEKISPPARRKRQMANMENGFREVLGLVRSMRENQEALLDSFQKLPEAVDSVKKLADHSARQSELLEAMNAQGEDGPLSGKFNDTLASMDKTTQQLLERSQRSEERLYTMLRRAQRRIAFMTLMVLLLFLGAIAGALYYVFPEETRSWLDGDGFKTPEAESQPAPAVTPTEEPEPPVAPVSNVVEVIEATATPEPPANPAEEEPSAPVVEKTEESTPAPSATESEEAPEEASVPVAPTATPTPMPTSTPVPVPDIIEVEEMPELTVETDTVEETTELPEAEEETELTPAP